MKTIEIIKMGIDRFQSKKLIEIPSGDKFLIIGWEKGAKHQPRFGEMSIEGPYAYLVKVTGLTNVEAERVEKDENIQVGSSTYKVSMNEKWNEAELELMYLIERSEK